MAIDCTANVFGTSFPAKIRGLRAYVHKDEGYTGHFIVVAGGQKLDNFEMTFPYANEKPWPYLQAQLLAFLQGGGQIDGRAGQYTNAVDDGGA
jgi:hypothetical protein